MNIRHTAIAAILVATTLSGCFAGEGQTGPRENASLQVPSNYSGDADEINWPNLSGVTLKLLDHGAFYVCDEMGARFNELTGAQLECTSEDDTGSALNRARLGAGQPEFDIMYGADNLLMHQAVEDEVFETYKPQSAWRIDPNLIFFNQEAWHATPVDHGYVALNIDHRHQALNHTNITNLEDVRDHAELFVTQDPRTSSPGLGFLIATISVLGEDEWQPYWNQLFENGVKVTSGWTEAYVTHFSGGYGVWEEGHIGDRPIVTSYTESPAYEAYFGAEEIADVLLNSTEGAPVMHQIQTMAILNGTPNLEAAQAWIEFTLTDDFQQTAADPGGVYPVVSTVDANEVYGNLDPEPGTFEVADFDFHRDGARVAEWVSQWVSLCESHNCV